MHWYLGVIAWCLTSVNAITRPPRQPVGNGTKLLTFNNTVRTRGFSPYQKQIEWIKSPSDSDLITFSIDGLEIQNAITNNKKVLIPFDKAPPSLSAYWLNPDQTKVLWAVNSTKQYRYSYFANYVVQNIEDGNVTLLPGPGDIAYAEWSPAARSNLLAFVRNNNIYIWQNGNITQITYDGGVNRFNGVPDWVYEEEVLSDRSAMWFSPDGKYLAFLSFNEAKVPTYDVPFYETGQPFSPAYPAEHKIRYPKTGYPNPLVDVKIIDLTNIQDRRNRVKTLNLGMYEPTDLVVGAVQWITDGHSKLIIRGFNRQQDHSKWAIYDLESGTTSVVRSRDGSDGWLENDGAIKFAGKVKSPQIQPGKEFYLDLSDVTGWQHMYLWPTDGLGNIALTQGNWEVREIVHLDRARGIVYFTSSERHPTDSHLYSLNIETGVKTAMVNNQVSGWWSASFSKDGNYYVLNYDGPNVPYQELYSISSSTPLRTLANNEELISLLSEYDLPHITYFDLIHPSGYNLSAALRWPANFDPTKKYPVLLTPYGGPGSQQVSKQMMPLNWNAYIASDPELQFATFTVDNRGTGSRGRAFRNTVARQLGKLEAEDQVWAAEQLAQHYDWVDANHVGIWGWSYGMCIDEILYVGSAVITNKSTGGYLSAKTVEVGSPVIKYGMSTAPLQDWRFYDSIYTERYMGLLPSNSSSTYYPNSTNNYYQASVHNTAGFKNIAGKFLIQHGTGDDNVHFQNTAALVDLMVKNGVSPEKFEAQLFTDSDHNIQHDNANVWLYRQLSGFLLNEKRRVSNVTESHEWSRIIGTDGQRPVGPASPFVELD